MPNKKNKKAFTLTEVLIAILLVGLTIVSLITANLHSTQVNSAGVDMSTAEFLLEQIRELSSMLTVIDPNSGTATFGPESGETLAVYDDLDDFDTAAFSPPIAADRTTLSAFSEFSQQVTVQNVSASNFDTIVTDHASDFVKVTVKVLKNSTEISSASWIRARL